jgi:hypothetical protein
MRCTAIACGLAVLAAGPVAAEDDHAHVAEAEGLRVVHAWTRAATAGEAFVFAEIENRGSADRVLTGAEAAGAAAGQVVGFGFRDGEAAWTVLSGVPVAAGGELHLEPEVLAIRLEGLATPLAAGDHVDVLFVFDGLKISAEAEVLDPEARGHSHAGHSH